MRYNRRTIILSALLALLFCPFVMISAAAKTEQFKETYDRVEYTYVLNGTVPETATIVRIQLGNQTEKYTLCLPETLGGYNVTAVDPSKSGEVGYWEYGGHWSTVGGGAGGGDLRLIEKIVIPEGYENIAYGAFTRDYETQYPYAEYVFPESLKTFDFNAVARIKVNNKDIRFPECQYIPYSGAGHFAVCLTEDPYDYNKVTLPVSAGKQACILLDALPGEPRTDEFYVYHVYIPNEIFTDTGVFEDCLYYGDYYNNDVLHGLYGEVVDDYTCQKTYVIHCSKGSLAEEILTQANYTVITDDVFEVESVGFDYDVLLKVGSSADNKPIVLPENANWQACRYVSSNPSVIKVDSNSGRITALADGVATITATSLNAGKTASYKVMTADVEQPVYTKIDSRVLKAAPEDPDEPYYSQAARNYCFTVAGQPTKLQVVSPDGGTRTYNRGHDRVSIAQSGEDHEVWTIKDLSLPQGEYTILPKYGKTWDEKGMVMQIDYTLPAEPSPSTETRVLKAEPEDPDEPYYSQAARDYCFTVADQPAKLQVVFPDGGTRTYDRGHDRVSIAQSGEDHEVWTIKGLSLPQGEYTILPKYGKTWDQKGLVMHIEYTPPAEPYPSTESRVLEAEPEDPDEPYYSRAARNYCFTVADHPAKLQVVFPDGSTRTYDRGHNCVSIAKSGEGFEVWTIKGLSLPQGKYTILPKYGKTWDEKGLVMWIGYTSPDEPALYTVRPESVTAANGNVYTVFEFETSKNVEKLQFVYSGGATSTYTAASYSNDEADGLRHWSIPKTIYKGTGSITFRLKADNRWYPTVITVPVN